MWRGYFAIAFMCLSVVMAAIFNLGCTDGSGSQQIEATVSPVAAVEPTSVPTVVLTPTTSSADDSGEVHASGTGPTPTRVLEVTPKPTPQPTPTPVPALSPADVYARVAPSVAMVLSSVGWGSGVLLRDGYLVTNHHVVWPDRRVRVLFPDGRDFGSVPVVAVDPMADVALLGPVKTAAKGLRFSKGENLPVGSHVFLVGYPGEVDESAEPTIVSGVLSRFRRWQQAGITYLQTDASIAGGQSGGALVDAGGRLIGISGFSFTDANYALVASAVDVGRIVGRLKRSADTLALGDRVFPEGRGELEFFITLKDWWDRRDFVFTVPEATTVDFELACEGEAKMYLYTGTGTVVMREDQDGTSEWLNVALPKKGIYFLQVGQHEGELVRCKLTSSVRLLRLPDPDDGRAVVKGRVIAGNLDHYRDVDWFLMSLKEGETVEVTTDSLNADTKLWLRCRDCGGNEIAQDDDGGDGLFGTNSRVIYRAESDGEFVIGVDTAEGGTGGGYYLSVKRALSGSVLTPLSDERVAEGDALANQLFDCLEANEGTMDFLVTAAAAKLVAEGMDRDIAEGMVELLLGHRDEFVSVMRERLTGDLSDLEEFLETWCKGNDPQSEGSSAEVGPLFWERFGEGRVFGPLNLPLRHDPPDGKIERKSADVRLDDFLVSATFLNPYSGVLGNWDYGFFLRDDRDLESGRFGYVVVTSEGKWSLRWRDRATGKTTVVSSGALDGLDVSAGGRNVLGVAVFGDRGLFLVNGEFVAVLDVSDMPESGDIAVITGAFKGNEATGGLTRVRDFEIWTLAMVHDSAAGEIEIGPNGTGRYPSGADALDFLVEVELTKPTGDVWHQGFMVRVGGPDRLDTVALNGDNAWFHGWKAEGGDLEISGGFAGGEPGDRRHLLLVGFGPVGLFFVDGELVSRLDLSGNLERGEVMLVGGTDDDNVGEMRFVNFRVWAPG